RTGGTAAGDCKNCQDRCQNNPTLPPKLFNALLVHEFARILLRAVAPWHSFFHENLRGGFPKNVRPSATRTPYRAATQSHYGPRRHAAAFPSIGEIGASKGHFPPGSRAMVKPKRERVPALPRFVHVTKSPPPSATFASAGGAR